MMLPALYHSKGKIPSSFQKPRTLPKHSTEFIRDKILSMNYKDTRFNR